MNNFRYRLLLFLAFLLSMSCLQSQTVGLVLSGGGARGITHVGIIKALEENEVPIDYITGTSMGAIVGSLYAMGYSWQEMIDLFKSEDFKRWSTGEMDNEFSHYYRNDFLRPEIAEIRLKINGRKLPNVSPKFIPTSFVSPRQMNYAFLELYAQATAACEQDFDKLFIPFRCVAADVYAEKPVIFNRGSLGDAVRASMTFPFMFKPIVVDDRLLFDGGIYNNFPVDVMRADFKPDFMIGSVVTGNPTKPDEDDAFQQLNNLIVRKINYTIAPQDGILFDFPLDNINMFDFSKVDELVKLGYDSTIAHIQEIKSRIDRQKAKEILAQSRQSYRKSLPEFLFKNVYITGADSMQTRYVESAFHYGDDVFTLKDFKAGYFTLVADDKISEVHPKAVYNPQNGYFDLHLKVKIQNKLKLSLGVNLSSSTSNVSYLGLIYQDLRDYAQTAYADVQFGRMYNALGAGFRMDPSLKENFYLKIYGVLHRFDYYQGNRFFYQDDRVAEFSQFELYSKFAVGMPLTRKGRMEYGIGYGNMIDYYRISGISGLDKSVFNIGSLFAHFESSTLNQFMYPTAGFKRELSLQLLGGDEKFIAGTVPAVFENPKVSLWGQAKSSIEHYYKMSNKLTIGTYGELVYTSRKALANYQVSLIQAPAFRPTIHSQTVYNAAFSANEYAAVGLKPIFQIRDQLHWRNEFYFFLPYRTILRQTDNQMYYSNPFSRMEFMGETALVFNFRIATASVFMNYYSHSFSPVNVGVNVGLMLFNKKFME